MDKDLCLPRFQVLPNDGKPQAENDLPVQIQPLTRSGFEESTKGVGLNQRHESSYSLQYRRYRRLRLR